MPSINWHCPYCHHKVTITDDRRSESTHILHVDNSAGQIALSSMFMVCPNGQCRKPTLKVGLKKWKENARGQSVAYGDLVEVWHLLPESDARQFPDHVPSAIREDYGEACLIRDKSPKASATLARRALQGVLRDFYGVKPGRLVDEIDALEDKMESELFEAIHGVRKVGNIGAHMEADINLIVDVDPDEAQLLIELVETMIEETYVRREQRSNRLQKVAALAKAKEQERKAVTAPPAQAALPEVNDRT